MQFPIRLGSISLHLNRKLFAHSFLPVMAPSPFTSTGNLIPVLLKQPVRDKIEKYECIESILLKGAYV